MHPTPLADIIGIPARVPTIRSSDWGLIRSDPFKYMLTRRFGIQPLLRYAEALNRGTWFHRRVELCHMSTAEAMRFLTPALEDRRRELKEACERTGRDPKNFLEREERDFAAALAWFTAASKVKINSRGQSFVDFLMQPCFRILGTEVQISILLEYPIGLLSRVIQIDQLIYNEKENTLWDHDTKTTSQNPRQRLSTVSIEFQSLHYGSVIRDALGLGLLQRHFGLPDDVKFGGRLHTAVQKPTIKLSDKDRDCEEYAHVLKSGKRKGQIEIRRTWSGEPRLDNYLKRCQDWYLGQGIHIDRAPEVVAEPPVNISTTPASLLFDRRRSAWYSRMVEEITKYATANPEIENFPPGNVTFDQATKESQDGQEQADPQKSFEAFYLLDPDYWSDIIKRDFHIVDRDADVSTPPGIKVLGAQPREIYSP